MVSAFLLFVAFWSLSHGCSSFIKGLLTRPLAQSRTMEAKLEKTQTCMGEWRRAGRGVTLFLFTQDRVCPSLPGGMSSWLLCPQ